MEASIDQNYMREALKEAKKAYKKDEVPVGAVIVKERRNNRKRIQFKGNQK